MGLDYSITANNSDLATAGKAALALANELLVKADLFPDPEYWRNQIVAERDVVLAQIQGALRRVQEPLNKPERKALNARGVQQFEQLVWIQAKMYLTYFNDHGVSWNDAEYIRAARTARSA